jgi:ABC-type polysaccharide/polyol phosphate export permease
MAEGAIEAITSLISEIWTFRSHIKIVFKEQFRAVYAGTGLGIFWSYVLPLVPLTVYWALSRLRVFPDFEGVDGATFLTFGVTLWFLFVGCVQTPIQVVQSRNKEAMKTAFPLSASIVSGFAQLLFDTLVRCVLVIVVVAATQSWPTWQALVLPMVLFPALLLFVGVGLFLGILNVIYNDVSRVVTILLQYGIFVSGVIFPLYDTGLLSILNLFNPFAVFIDACRAIVFRGAIENVNAYLAMTGIALIMFVLSCRAFFIMEYRIRGIT